MHYASRIIAWFLFVAGATAAGARTVLDLQHAVRSQRAELPPNGFVRLIRPSPNLENWYLLQVKGPGAQQSEYFHLENADPATTRVRLSRSLRKLVLETASGKHIACAPWGKDRRS